MVANDKTVFDPGATMPESDKTVLESGAALSDGGTTMLEAALSDAAERADADARENVAIIQGDMILDTYRIESMQSRAAWAAYGGCIIRAGTWTWP